MSILGKILQWIGIIPPTPAPVDPSKNPNLFSPEQKQFIKTLFPTGWTHMDNLSQAELLRIAVTIRIFGYDIPTGEVFQYWLHIFAYHNLIQFSPSNLHLVKRCA